MPAQVGGNAVVVEERVVDVEEEDDVHPACSRQAANTAGSNLKASSSGPGSSSGRNQASSETSSAGHWFPPTTRAVQNRLRVEAAPGSSPYQSIQTPRNRIGSTSRPVSSRSSRL